MLNGKGQSASDMRLERVLYDEGDAPAFCAGPPAERGKERTEYPGGARSAILASSTAGAQPGLRQQHDVDVVVLNEGGYVGPPPEVRTDLALKRQTRSVFSAEEELRGM